VFLVKSSSGVPSTMLDVIGYFVSHLAMVDISSLATGHHSYSEAFLPHEEELYNKLVLCPNRLC